MKSLWQRFLAWDRERAFWASERRLMMTWYQREAEQRLGHSMSLLGLTLLIAGIAGTSQLWEGTPVFTLKDYLLFVLACCSAIGGVLFGIVGLGKANS